ncbi:DUF6678 family protein [Vibrio splendidus]|uniref:DUF6678 family protein n=1 Tax=Vibrio splendidus TaxID=29497 RepID=UPI001F493836|nr:DUF6678 family protein [Vibrio splendidus]
MKIRERFSCSYMSNAKWRKLFSVVNENNVQFTHCQWKLVSETDPKLGHLPDFDSLGEYYVGDCGALNGPFEFELIEWLFIPTSIGYKPYEGSPTIYNTQGVQHLIDQLNVLGEFEFTSDDEGLKIFGYKP